MCVMIGTVWLLLQRVQQMQDKLFQMANHDVLTQLPNRQYLMSHLAELAEKSLKNRTSFVLLMIDLDNFKSVNDKAGHDAGDELLRSIAAYLDGFEDANATSFHPSAGALSVSARLGGDEFIQIIPDIGTLAETEVMAARLLDKFGSPAINPFIEKYNVGLSIGAAIFPFHTSNYHTLIKYADLAMYNAKKGGKHGYRVYTEEMSEAELDNDGEHDRRHRAR
jgi:diguanylate cyclase (GGDEF)-like protein